MEHDPFWLHAEAILRSCRSDDHDSPIDNDKLLSKVQSTHLLMRCQMHPLTPNDRVLLGQHTRALLLSQLSQECRVKETVKHAKKAALVPSTPVHSTPSTSTGTPVTPASVLDLFLVEGDRSGAISPRAFRRTSAKWKSPLGV